MKFFAIASSSDTLIGLRLAGIEGVFAEEKKDVQEAITKAISDPTIGVLLIGEKLAVLCPDLIYDLKLHSTRTLVVEIPDRFGTGRTPDSITRYIREAIGIKV